MLLPAAGGVGDSRSSPRASVVVVFTRRFVMRPHLTVTRRAVSMLTSVEANSYGNGSKKKDVALALFSSAGEYTW